MSDQSIEQEIQAKGLTAPRVTPEAVESNIVREEYFTAHDGVHGTLSPVLEMLPDSFSRLTFCVIALKNGFIVMGGSACASAENFNAEIGRKIARQNAVAKIWPLMGYELRSNLALRDGQMTGEGAQ